MPKIKLSGFSNLEKTILTKTFKANVTKLGLLKSDFKVEVSKEHLGRPGLHARVANPAKDHFIVEINSNEFNLFDATSALGHETVHMKQHLDGTMWNDDDGTYWNKDFYPEAIQRFLYQHLPWEKEAWAIQGELHKHAFNSLSPEERKHVDRTKSHGLRRLWDE